MGWQKRLELGQTSFSDKREIWGQIVRIIGVELEPVRDLPDWQHRRLERLVFQVNACSRRLSKDSY